MGLSFLNRFFGAAAVPESLLSRWETEGIILSDENLKGSTTYRNFRAPGNSAGWRRVGFIASIALTKARLVAVSGSGPLIDVPLADERLRSMRFSVEKERALCIAFDAGLFQPEWHGTIEYRFRTPRAAEFLELLQKLGDPGSLDSR